MLHELPALGSRLSSNSKSRRQRNQDRQNPESKSARKPIPTLGFLANSNTYLLSSNYTDPSIASEFFTGDWVSKRAKEPATTPRARWPSGGRVSPHAETDVSTRGS